MPRASRRSSKRPVPLSKSSSARSFYATSRRPRAPSQEVRSAGRTGLGIESSAIRMKAWAARSFAIRQGWRYAQGERAVALSLPCASLGEAANTATRQDKRQRQPASHVTLPFPGNVGWTRYLIGHPLYVNRSHVRVHRQLRAADCDDSAIPASLHAISQSLVCSTGAGRDDSVGQRVSCGDLRCATRQCALSAERRSARPCAQDPQGPAQRELSSFSRLVGPHSCPADLDISTDIVTGPVATQHVVVAQRQRTVCVTVSNGSLCKPVSHNSPRRAISLSDLSPALMNDITGIGG